VDDKELVANVINDEGCNDAMTPRIWRGLVSHGEDFPWVLMMSGTKISTTSGSLLDYSSTTILTHICHITAG